MIRASLVASLVWAVALLTLPGTAFGKSPAQQLIETYAPITMLREEQDPPCETSAEQYEPTSVSTVLGNPTVRLQRVEEDGVEVLVKRAPTAADIAGLGDPTTSNCPATRSATPVSTRATSPS